MAWEVVKTLVAGEPFVWINFDFIKYRYRVVNASAYSLNMYKDSTSSGHVFLSINLGGEIHELYEGMKGKEFYQSKILTSGDNYLYANASAPGVRIEREALWTPPNLKTNINGAIKEFDKGWVNVNGELKEIDKMWTNINGVLREV